MASPWVLYQRQPSFVLGFHGTEKAIVDDLLLGHKEHLSSSRGLYEWLGHGIYFWENDPQRGLEWAKNGNAKNKIKVPSVVGAALDLGLCLDLTTQIGLEEVRIAFETLKDTTIIAGNRLPSNTGGADKVKRELDCQVIQSLHMYRKIKTQPDYDSVRAPFPEDAPLYDGAGFRLRNHIQIAIISSDCIKGYFRPIQK